MWRYFDHDGLRRRYFEENPAGVTDTTPILVCLHGSGGSPAGFEGSADWRAAANKYGMKVVLPEGYEMHNGGHTWNVEDGIGAADHAGVDSVGFIDAILDREQSFNRDIYIVGMSKGAMLAAKLANESQYDIKGIGMVGGVLVDQSDTTLVGTKVVHIHGDADAIIPMGGNADRRPVLPGFEELIDDNGPLLTATVVVEDGTITTYVDPYGVCWGIFYAVTGGEHTWNVSSQIVERDFILDNLLA